MRVAVVVQRFGRDVVGGAEAHARQLCYHLATDLGWKIEVLTSCAKDYRTWGNELPAGMSVDGPISVTRYPVPFGRFQLILPLYSRVLFRFAGAMRRMLPAFVLRKLETIWMIMQGPYCPSLCRDLLRRQNDFDLIVCFTYLYYPTWYLGRSLRAPKLIVPTAHDEPPFYFLTVGELLKSFGVIAANSTTEMELIERVHRIPSSQQRQVGLGFDAKGVEIDDYRPLTGGYALYLGRISAGKGVVELCASWENRSIERTHNLRLKLAGVLDDDVSSAVLPSSDLLGRVGDVEKWSLIAQSSVVINPSPHESLSMLVLEAMYCGIPVIANGKCPIFKFYKSQMPLVFTYETDQQLEDGLVAVQRISSQPERFLELRRICRAWVEQHYSWNAIMEKFRTIANSIT